MTCEGLSHFKHFSHQFKDDETAKFLLRKNVYCYDYIDSYERFDEKELPSKEAFYNVSKKNTYLTQIMLTCNKCGRSLIYKP